MAAPADPLDEIEYSKPETVGFYTRNGMPYMHENMLHYYISESPFFDWGSKNGTEVQLSSTDPQRQQLLHDRREFERHLAAANGVEYAFVEGETMEFNAEGEVARGGMWVLRKQDRQKGVGPKGKDELTTLGTYYLMGEKMHQAPAVGDVLSAKLTAASTAMAKLYERAAELPRWSAAEGHTYLAASSKATAGSTASRGGTPERSRQNSVIGDTASMRSGSVEPVAGTVPGSKADEDRLANALLRSSMASFRAHGTEYSDENPLLGEPGHFTFSSSTAAVKKRKAEEEAAAQAAAKEKEARANSRAATPPSEISPFAVKKQPSPPAGMSEAKAGKADREKREKKDGKLRRRKSRHGGAATPGGVATPAPMTG
nr:hypothetical protein B0A51_02023 [Rachicladosporium sp. CCFEE 5018]